MHCRESFSAFYRRIRIRNLLPVLSFYLVEKRSEMRLADYPDSIPEIDVCQ